MPIKPENKSRYPKNWKQIRTSILERAHNRCEFCGRLNHSHFWNENTGKMVKVVLTVAHLDHTPENCNPENLRALCQRCHNQYDAKHRAETRRKSKEERKKCEDCYWYMTLRDHKGKSWGKVCYEAVDGLTSGIDRPNKDDCFKSR